MFNLYNIDDSGTTTFSKANDTFDFKANTLANQTTFFSNTFTPEKRVSSKQGKFIFLAKYLHKPKVTKVNGSSSTILKIYKRNNCRKKSNEVDPNQTVKMPEINRRSLC